MKGRDKEGQANDRFGKIQIKGKSTIELSLSTVRFRELPEPGFRNWMNYQTLRAGIPGAAQGTRSILEPFLRIAITSLAIAIQAVGNSVICGMNSTGITLGRVANSWVTVSMIIRFRRPKPSDQSRSFDPARGQS